MSSSFVNMQLQPMRPDFTFPLKNIDSLQPYKNIFDSLETGGIVFTTSQKLSLDEAHLNALIRWFKELIALKGAAKGVTAEFLLSLSGKTIDTVGWYSSSLIELVTAFDLENPLEQFLTMNNDILVALLDNGKEFSALKYARLNVTWENLISMTNKEKINKIGECGLNFAVLKKLGINFTWEQFCALTVEQKRTIKFYDEHIIAAKQAGIEFSWEQLISLPHSREQKTILKTNSANLPALKKAGIPISWTEFTKEIIKIPSAAEKKTE